MAGIIWSAIKAMKSVLSRLDMGRPFVRFSIKNHPTAGIGSGARDDRICPRTVNAWCVNKNGVEIDALRASSTPRPAVKRRSQFRIKSADIGTLYARMENASWCGDRGFVDRLPCK
jgi:hypothetical protein